MAACRQHGRIWNRLRWAGILVLLLSIQSGFSQSPQYVFLNHPDTVRRLAMDLMGTRPEPADLETGRGELGNLIDRYMETDRFYDRMMWLANDIFLTRNMRIEYFMESYDYEREKVRYDVFRSVGEEPLRLFVYIVRNDLPLTELVTADYTVADSTLAWFWNIDYPGPPKGSQWLRGRYKDEREHAGVLSQTSFYYRYHSTYSNKQRHRANNITRIFLDDDHLLRNVSLDLRRQANDPDLDLLDATRNNPGCLACHTTLDGISAHLFTYSIGPEGETLYARETFSTVSPQGTKRSRLQVGRNPTYYGYPSSGIRDLGAYIARDPRFARTMVKHIYRFIVHRDPDYRDRDLLNRYTDFFTANGYNVKSLIKEICLSDEYRAVGVVTGGKKTSPGIREKPDGKARDPSAPWREFIKTVSESKIASPSKEERIRMARVHAIQAGLSWRRKNASFVSGLLKGSTGTPVTIQPPPPEEIVQPFKLATPEQLHSLGEQLVGEIWDGYEGGQWMPKAFPHLLYNTDLKVAAGGYDGEELTRRRWTVPPTYLLVLERWAEVLAEDVVEKELSESVPWTQRRVFTLITGKEDPRAAEPSVRRQIAEWFDRFYGEQVDPWGTEVDDVFGVLLLAKEEAAKEYDPWFSTEIAWSHVLGMLLGDPRMAIY